MTSIITTAALFTIPAPLALTPDLAENSLAVRNVELQMHGSSVYIDKKDPNLELQRIAGGESSGTNAPLFLEGWEKIWRHYPWGQGRLSEEDARHYCESRGLNEAQTAEVFGLVKAHSSILNFQMHHLSILALSHDERRIHIRQLDAAAAEISKVESALSWVFPEAAKQAIDSARSYAYLLEALLPESKYPVRYKRFSQKPPFDYSQINNILRVVRALRELPEFGELSRLQDKYNETCNLRILLITQLAEEAGRRKRPLDERKLNQMVEIIQKLSGELSSLAEMIATKNSALSEIISQGIGSSTNRRSNRP